MTFDPFQNVLCVALMNLFRGRKYLLNPVLCRVFKDVQTTDGVVFTLYYANGDTQKCNASYLKEFFLVPHEIACAQLQVDEYLKIKEISKIPAQLNLFK